MGFVFEGTEGVGDEVGGECDEELVAEGGEVGLHGWGTVEQREDLVEPWRRLELVVVVRGR